MINAHYLHRLPADYDLFSIRQRATRRGALWDNAPDLCFKAFLLRESGKHGASENSYSSLYLWQSDQGFINFLLNNRYRHVTETFGRAQIATRVVLDACRGQGKHAQHVVEQSWDIHPDRDLGHLFSNEIERNRAAADGPGVVAAVTAIDTVRWRFSRFLLVEDVALIPDDGAVRYEILYLAQPLLHALQSGAAP